MGAENEVRLDVSDLEPPDPLLRILAAAEELAEGQHLHVLHRRTPCLLYTNLEQRGFAHHTLMPGPEAPCEVYIWRREDRQARHALPSEITKEIHP